jgi:hypothetical protein
MSGFEQHVEAPDRRWQYLLFAAEPYETISFKVISSFLMHYLIFLIFQIPSREVDKSEGKFWTYYNTETKQVFFFYLKISSSFFFSTSFSFNSPLNLNQTNIQVIIHHPIHDPMVQHHRHHVVKSFLFVLY